MNFKVTDSVYYIGVNDRDIDVFESQYPVPNGVSYNSYVIMDEKICVMDTVDPRGTDVWLENLKDVLGGKAPDYLVVHHVEPDHAGSIRVLADMYPEMQLVVNAKSLSMLSAFFDFDFSARAVVMKEGDTLSLGSHTLTFVMAPMVHWPEVMVSYEASEKLLFAADGFGKFGALDCDEDWESEARRYFINIVGKYGTQVQALLKKAAALDISKILPLHGPVLTENLGRYIALYDTWSSYKPQYKGVLVACASIHGHTKAAALKLCDMLRAKGETVEFIDLTRQHVSYAVAGAFEYDRLVVAACTYDGSLFPAAEDFISHLKVKTFRDRTVGLIENGSWAPMAGKLMRAAFEGMKDITVLEPVVTLKSALNAASEAQLTELCDALTK